MATEGRVDQAAASGQAVSATRDFLGGPHPDGAEWVFDFGAHLESNWGAVYGGALAAGTVSIARILTPERSPRSLHIQIVRSVPRGVAYATAEVRHGGRTVGTVQIDLYDPRRKLAAIALVTMVTPDSLPGDLHNTDAAPAFQVESLPHVPDKLAFGAAAPIVETLDLLPERDGVPVRYTAANVRASVDGSMPFVGPCAVPWDELEFTGPEAACLAADARIAPPALYSTVPTNAVGPNTDLSLRFSTAPATPVIQAASTMLSIQRGTATVGLEIHAGDQQLAHGLATLLFRES